VRGAVARAEVGLDLDQSQHPALAVELAHQEAPEQVARDRLGAAFEEGAIERLERRHRRRF